MENLCSDWLLSFYSIIVTIVAILISLILHNATKVTTDKATSKILSVTDEIKIISQKIEKDVADLHDYINEKKKEERKIKEKEENLRKQGSLKEEYEEQPEGIDQVNMRFEDAINSTREKEIRNNLMEANEATIDASEKIKALQQSIADNPVNSESKEAKNEII